MNYPLPQRVIDAHILAALHEDLGDRGDITTHATIPRATRATASIVARQNGVISGTDFARSAFRLIGACGADGDSMHAADDPVITTYISDGDKACKGDKIMKIMGPARDILSAERVALNFITHMSGIATATHAFYEAISHSKAKIACTRKTLPGLRAIQKYAVRCGGGINHRFGLYDAVMIKDNHIKAAGSIRKALTRARDYAGHMTKIEIEVDALHQLSEVLETSLADAVLLDNMSLADLKEATEMAAGRIILEASGTVTLDRVAAIARTGVDYISSGWLTHSAPALDLGLDFY